MMPAFILALSLALFGFIAFYRPWQLTWGATSEEVSVPMMGDDVVVRPTFNATRAITVDAPPEMVWPWLVQIGFGRAGWYSYDLLDNLGRHSSETLVPELQHLDVGDLVPLGPGKDAGMRVREFDPSHYIVWWDGKLGFTTWTWTLTRLPEGSTRLVTRIRSRASWRHPSTLIWTSLYEVADFPMIRKCLLGIKRRAEHLVGERSTQKPAPT